MNNWKWEILYEEQNNQWKHYINAPQSLKISDTNVFNLSAAKKILGTNCTFFVEKQEGNDKFLK